MTRLIEQIITDYPHIDFKAGKRFAWSPANSVVWYEKKKLGDLQGLLALLHEVSHALLQHKEFENDMELMNYEVSAWKNARILADKYSIDVSDEYIDDCLESYRDWLYKRSTCVECGTNSLQDTSGAYVCHICGTKWKVPNSQLCRVQRRKI